MDDDLIDTEPIQKLFAYSFESEKNKNYSTLNIVTYKTQSN
jgi:hypothetical protein